MGAPITKQDLQRTLRDYPTKRDLDKAIGKAMRRQDMRFAKRIAESEDWSEKVFATNERVDKLEKEMIRRFNESDGKIDALEHRLTDKIEASEHRIVSAIQAIVAQLTPKAEHERFKKRTERRLGVLERKST